MEYTSVAILKLSVQLHFPFDVERESIPDSRNVWIFNTLFRNKYIWELKKVTLLIYLDKRY